MLYLLINKEKQAPWQTEYENAYIRELRAIKYPFKIIRESRIDLDNTDFLWVMHFKDLESDYVKNTNALVISQVNGTSANPWIYQVNSDVEKKQMTEVISIALTFNDRVDSAFKKHFNTYSLPTGFPVEVPKLTKIEKKNKIVIGGRISPDKQFYLSAYLLKDLLKEYEIVFCMGKGEQKWLDFYEQKKFEKMGYKFKICTRNQWLNQLNESRFMFTCSLGDVMSVATVEAIKLGCYPLVPDFKEGLPAHDSYINKTYPPFSKSSIEYMVRNYKEVFSNFSYDESLFDPRICAYKLIIGLKKYENDCM